ncbi:MAG: glycogen phosphorylase [Candidatus Edwardsbacteria bacterium RIFOXYD12_FULL_50_11]|uniref:Alpha-1,4 glucan phosphorylase n=1 Tax=Candidatus Edwardsbacteria bacterium GWF2_54_11 TaxID=1817851 RepID=A0A1F5RFB1_9BACT|nr:MAG: glycogen phosphorylase [Candidatus Edwardsbacteria bacterium RifOxyC12_full_54_24]OGF07904.1 MAG: glycogen phosphorylase [Candidatus Edwardsbacteria bacterium RifOxyA12_full_54_48]OGF10152.1 MAG: glycogen phosphorylase [Candidatus Edwardsbacteria bacterium GWE2_54_12]OGF13094.1 MAG: glycogen phosphorylase [Candidatus Edwardsbacteria bacterium GWF2_54_11]OGF15064.1 MAG: glycogen phosphorylase [Candidatus Edwardsbacteria bacterium RIFOXYD12_FULL_50_11]OGJ19156.1 MAG: glycogen phosphoryla
MPEKKIKISDEVTRQGIDKESLKRSFLDHISFSLAKDKYSATKRDYYLSLALAIRDRLVERWVRTQQKYYQVDAKRVYYLSLEFLMGRSLGNSIMNLEMDFACRKALEELGFDLEEMMDVEWDAGLGNGGLGRLAACYLDSMAFHALPAYGYGIRYEYGIFFQKIQNGYQVETPDNWLRYQNPWELPRPEHLYPVKFYGRVEVDKWPDGRPRFRWQDGEEVMAMAYDTPVPGHGNDTVNTLRLWSAKATREFDLSYFNSGDYVAAVEDKNQKENITRVLYPSDNVYQGKELRLKQQYFFVSATLQDAIRRYKKTQPDMTAFPEKTVFQLNDTHPAIAIPELMRLLMDQEGMEWQEAWDITGQVFAYTNHTVLPEALEHWPVDMIERMLPRHWQIIGEVNRRLMDEVGEKYPGDEQKKQAMSIISSGPEPQVRMAHLAIAGCFSVNGVAELHTRILREIVFPEFNEFFPGKFNNKTNGITPRRWLKKCNPGLSELITKHIGPEWIKDLTLLKELAPLAGDSLFRERWRVVKRENKIRLAEYIRTHNGQEINVNSLFDVQVKRFHEYKRQLLNVLGVIAQYNRIKKDPKAPVVPRTVIFGGKAAPGYFMAKLIIKLINCVADRVNSDPDIGNKLKVVFLANYGVSLAELIMPAAELSEQISTAGMEASGTGNMKFALNGALTIGTLDGANIEIMEEVGQDNIFIFGLTAEEVSQLRARGYDPQNQYHSNGQLKEVLDQLDDGFFCRDDPGLFKPIVDSLLKQGDYYLLLADFASYMECQERVSRTYLDPDQWSQKAIINVARMGKFSSDRSIKEYAEQIWQARSVPIE